MSVKKIISRLKTRPGMRSGSDVRLPTRRGKLWWVVAVALIAGVVLVGTDGGEESYFPLESGWSWQYQLHMTASDGSQRHMRDRVVNLDPVEVQAGRAVPRQNAVGNLYFYQSDAGGVRRVAYALGGDVGLIEPPQQWLFKLPATVDDSWTITSQPFLLVGRMPPLIGVRPEEEVTLTAQVVSTSDRVHTPAGTYDSCLQVRAEGTFSFTGDSRMPPINVTVEQTDWYAPGVGWVKSVRQERSDSEAFGTVTLSRTLEHIDRGFMP